ncbi:methyltransferase domain-containing protein [Candidatus Saccharibacteria bacterium]|nr:methyltransferase domain-containing protein [Candidatus Saccharibacteria bacterium]MCB9821258.1 methyltransferase domain-containing protein [Candidatus Nomurabacteria bacterium]
MPKKPKAKSVSEPYVVQYETKNAEFEYARFWDGRSYEDRAERMLLKQLIGYYHSKSKWLVDIGGSYGRLLNLYAKRFKQVVIVDYATNEFYLSLKPAKDKKLALSHIAANAYHLPFADDTQSAIISIRVIHHLTDPDLFFKEISRVLKPGGTAIIEAANKNSLKRLLKCILRADFSDWRNDWVDIGASGLQNDGSFQLIRNYHPKYLMRLLSEAGLVVVKRRSVSWFRRTPVAKLPKVIIDSLEKIMQIFSGWLFFGPSGWYVVRKPGVYQPDKASFGDCIVDPATKKYIGTTAQKKIQKTNKQVRYLDLRYPKPRR